MNSLNFLYNILAIALGGALGSLARFFVSEFFVKISKSFAVGFSRFPLGTFSVNAIGCFFAGVLYFFIIRNFDQFNSNIKNFLSVGFLGGFTTFSAFALDFFRLSISGQHLQAFSYAILSVIISILALFFGFYLTKIFLS